MENTPRRIIDSKDTYANASPIGVARLDVDLSYRGIGALLPKIIRSADEHAWEEVKKKMDYTYTYVDIALSALEQETGFLAQIKKQLKQGKKLLFKPNLVHSESINPFLAAPPPGSQANTEWIFAGAVLRWFHDNAGISYYTMCIGEGASLCTMHAAYYTHVKRKGRPVTPEATMEGRSDDFYGGWGFYFVRKYLSENGDSAMGDDPMRGLEESMAGTYIPPGLVDDKLMIYDTNQICDDPSKGREVHVPGGENATSIIMHKVIAGGDPNDPEDCAKYPGAVIINLCKLKIHTQSLITNAVKNLGLGLYPMLATRSGGCRWEYAMPHNSWPVLKNTLPHQKWMPDIDSETQLPKRDANGNYIVRETGGLTSTILDIIRVLDDLGVYMLHISDAIEVINRDHQGIGLGKPEAEGLIMASTDMVAMDVLGARYLFSNITDEEARGVGGDDNFGGCYVQKVPIPRYDGKNIITTLGYDNPMSRDITTLRAKQNNFGSSDYYIVGHDGVTDNPLVSSDGRLGILEDDAFKEIYTKKLYSATYKMPWDMQATFFGYLDAVDQLENTSLKKMFLDEFDESGDGVVTFEEYGKKGMFMPYLILSGHYMSKRGSKNESELFRTLFAVDSTMLRCTDPDWNSDGHHFYREQFYGRVAVTALMMSQFKKDKTDPFFPELTWGNGKWPSFSLAKHTCITQAIYGWRFPASTSVYSLYGCAVAYSDLIQNDRKLIGKLFGAPNPNAAQKYVEAVRTNEVEPFDFTVYVPVGFGQNGAIPNVEETSDPKRMFTAIIDKGRIQWPDVRLGED